MQRRDRSDDPRHEDADPEGGNYSSDRYVEYLLHALLHLEPSTMSRNSAGIYSLPAGNPVVTDTPVASSWANVTMDDIAAEMTSSLDRAGRGGMNAPLRLVDGTDATPALAFSTSPTTGLWLGAGRMGMSYNGAEVASVDSTGLVIPTGKTLTLTGQPALVTEAPSDGVLRGRLNGAWAPITASDVAFIGSMAFRPYKTSATIESYWVELIGQALIKTAYPRLWAWVQANAQFAANDTAWNNSNQGMFVDLGTTFRIPNLRGQFPRVANTTASGFDPSRAIGSVQANATATHTHNVSGSTGGESQQHTHPGGMSLGGGQGGGGGLVVSSDTGPNNQGHTHSFNVTSGVPSGNVASETRPVNTAYRAFIYAGNPL